MTLINMYFIQKIHLRLHFQFLVVLQNLYHQAHLVFLAHQELLEYPVILDYRQQILVVYFVLKIYQLNLAP